MYVAMSRDEESIWVYVPSEFQAMNDDGETYTFVRNVVEYSLLNEVGKISLVISTRIESK